MPICRIYTYSGECIKTFNTNDFGSTITIGRSSGCNVSLKGLAENNVSREHIILKVKGDKLMLESVGHSGVYYNAELIDTVEAKEGDIFRFSQLFLGIGEKGCPSDYDLTWEAQTENNQHRSVIWPGVNSIGASRDNYITVRTEDVSRIHGKITCEGNSLFYESAHASLAAEVNGIAVQGDKVELNVGDELTLCDTVTKVIKGLRIKQQAVVKRTLSSDASIVKKKKHSWDWSAALVIVILLVVLITILIIGTFYSILIF